MYDENSNSAAAAGLAALPSAASAPLNAAAAAAAAAAAPSSALVTQLFNVKDSRWLQVEVCREFQRGQCARSDQECKFAHPPPHVDVQQGRVTACYDSIKGRCTRENPKCKYLHPPQHIKDQLLINGRNNLALKNLISAQLTQSTNPPQLAVNPIIAQMQQQQQAALTANIMPSLPYPYYQGVLYSPILQQDPYAVSQLQSMVSGSAAGLQALAAANLLGTGSVASPSPTTYLASVAAGSGLPAVSTTHALSQPQSLQLPVQASQLVSAARKRPLEDDGSSSAAALASLDASSAHLLAAAAAAAAGVPCKRPAMDKNGAVMYHQSNATQTATSAAAAQYNHPYLLQSIQGGYVPAVSFTGAQLPPRY